MLEDIDKVFESHPLIILVLIVIFGLIGIVCYKNGGGFAIKDVPDELDPENIDNTYIFKDCHGYLILDENNKNVRKFTFIQAKEFAKENPSYLVKLLDPNYDTIWEIAETYFCV